MQGHKHTSEIIPSICTIYKNFFMHFDQNSYVLHIIIMLNGQAFFAFFNFQLEICTAGNAGASFLIGFNALSSLHCMLL